MEDASLDSCIDPMEDASLDSCIDPEFATTNPYGHCEATIILNHMEDAGDA